MVRDWLSEWWQTYFPLRGLGGVMAGEGANGEYEQEGD